MAKANDDERRKQLRTHRLKMAKRVRRFERSLARSRKRLEERETAQARVVRIIDQANSRLAQTPPPEVAKRETARRARASKQLAKITKAIRDTTREFQVAADILSAARRDLAWIDDQLEKRGS